MKTKFIRLTVFLTALCSSGLMMADKDAIRLTAPLADEAWDFDTLIDRSINLYAKWTQTQFEVTFCVSGEESYTMWENINTPIKVTNTSNSYAVWGY